MTPSRSAVQLSCSCALSPRTSALSSWASPQTPSLSKAGSGDGLAGYIAGLLSYATKWYKKEDIILFADKMIHEAAYLSQEEESEGIANILSARNKIVQVIKTDKKRS